MPKILIVDDDKNLRQIYARYLGMEGYEIAEAANAEEALSRSSADSFDAVLLDIRLPTLSGEELAPKIRESQPKTSLIISSCHDVDFQKKAVAGAQGYFNKTDGCRALLSQIKAVLHSALSDEAGIQ